MEAPDGDTWVALTEAPIDDVGVVYSWCVLPSCGAVVLFSGTVRDHADGRSGVTLLEYEAYVEHVEPRLVAIADEMRTRWSGLGRIALLHRVGPLRLGESSVIVAVSSPHRPEAFDAGRFGIDTLKETVPIWKREHWNDGADWATGAQHIRPVDGSTGR